VGVVGLEVQGLRLHILLRRILDPRLRPHTLIVRHLHHTHILAHRPHLPTHTIHHRHLMAGM
jgi:hypothetical protein